MVYCIAALEGDNFTDMKPRNEVKKFDTKKPVLKLDPSPPPMNQARFLPAVVAIGEKIFVFGGLSRTDTSDSPWAECLDTSQPEYKQKWKPLTQPPSRLWLDFPPFAIPYEANTIFIDGSDICMGTAILIGSRDVSQGALLYGVRDGVWKEYNFNHISISTTEVLNPVSVVCEKTIYWIHKMCIYAYDLDKHILYQGFMEESVLHDFDCGFDTTRMGPVSMHLKENIFCCFTVYIEDPLCPSKTGVVECTKFRVTKDNTKSGDEEVLHLHPMGYQSYECETMCGLSGVLPMSRIYSCPNGTGKRVEVLKRSKCSSGRAVRYESRVVLSIVSELEQTIEKHKFEI